MTPLETLTLATYFFVLIILAVYGWHRYYLVYLYMKHRNHVHVPKGKFQNLPRVTVQLPTERHQRASQRLRKERRQRTRDFDVVHNGLQGGIAMHLTLRPSIYRTARERSSRRVFLRSGYRCTCAE